MRDLKYKSKTGERLARILVEIGYADPARPGCIRLQRVADVVNRQLTGNRKITKSMLHGYIYYGKKISLEVASLLALHLEFKLEELAYERRPIPRPAGRKVRGVLDEIEPLV